MWGRWTNVAYNIKVGALWRRRKNMDQDVKEQQRAELHMTIWQIANDLRESADGRDFKSYVLGMLFCRFISENLTSYINKGEREAGNTEFHFTKLPDEDGEPFRDAIGLFIDGPAQAVYDGNQNKLGEQNQQDLLGAFVTRESVEHLAALGANSAIAANEYNTTVSSYVEAEDTREIVDITGLNAGIEQLETLQAALHTSNDAIVANLEGTLK